MPYLPLFNKLLSSVFVRCVSWSQYTVLQGLSLPGVICFVQAGGSEDLRGERLRGHSLFKNTAQPKGWTSRVRLVIEQAVIFIVSSGKSLFPVFGTKSGHFPTMNQVCAFTLKGPSDLEPELLNSHYSQDSCTHRSWFRQTETTFDILDMSRLKGTVHQN